MAPIPGWNKLVQQQQQQSKPATAPTGSPTNTRVDPAASKKPNDTDTKASATTAFVNTQTTAINAPLQPLNVPSTSIPVAAHPTIPALSPLSKHVLEAVTRPAGVTFENIYETDQRLRSGSYGTVYTAHAKADSAKGTTYAVKIFDRRKLKAPANDEAVVREVLIMKELISVPHIVQLIDFMANSEKLYMVLEYAAGGDVFDRLTQRTHYTEKDARFLSRRLLETMQAIHAAHIVHRDLKPENILLRDIHDDTSILLADFGFARHVSPQNMCHTRCGTPAFVAPEILLGLPYDTTVDLWSTGCLIYMLLGGYPPFQGSNHRELFRKIRAADFCFHDSYFRDVSVAAKQCMNVLFTVNPKRRWTASAALQCDWFCRVTDRQLQGNDLSGSLQEMKKFKPRQTWRSTAKAIGFAATAPFWNSDAVSFARQLSDWDLQPPTSKHQPAADTSDGAQMTGHNLTLLPGSNSTTTLKVAGTPAAPSSSRSLMGKRPVVRFDDVYRLKKVLRKGSYATVWLCEHKVTGDEYAAKIISRVGLQPKDDETVLNEVALMQSLSDNKYVIQLMDFYEEKDYFYMVMELMIGGDVFDRIVQRTHYTEKDARDLAVELLKAVRSIHRVGIAHRDIKPQNLLLKYSDDHANIKICDFGFARRVHTPESLTSRVGTPTYVAPEILKNVPHDERVDLWSIGVVIYVLLVGYPPFLDDDQTKLFSKIRTGTWEFYKEDWRHVSKDARDLIKGLLTVDPKERWSVEETLRCPWIKQDDTTLSSVNLSDSLRVLKEKKSRLRQLARAYLWMAKDGEDGDGKSHKGQPLEMVTSAQGIVNNNENKLIKDHDKETSKGQNEAIPRPVVSP